MPGFNSQTCGDQYTDACTIQNVWSSNGGWFSIVGEGVFLQMQYGTPANPIWTDEQQLGAGANSSVPAAATGIRFRNSTAGSNADVSANIAGGNPRPINYNYELEPVLNINSVGLVVSPGFPISFEHNGVLVGTEPTLDLADLSLNKWTVTDDGVNSRVIANLDLIPGTLLTYGTATANVTTTGGTFAAGADLLAAALTFTADGSSAYAVEVSAFDWSNSGANSILHANLDGADAGMFARLSTTGGLEVLSARGFLGVLAAGAHTINARLRTSTGGSTTATVEAGAGGAGTAMPLMVGVRLVG